MELEQCFISTERHSVTLEKGIAKMITKEKRMDRYLDQMLKRGRWLLLTLFVALAVLTYFSQNF
ncbi:MAG TPA: hypothetical protein DDZ80_10830 [Cyanobacteria bacterium UBA8803]|nr:hypothetical protein [Cyanobacteria bacterium UBA9273]HBL58986.1 hypothetical protein [Cyanobacteria bacterium UBA8803]